MLESIKHNDKYACVVEPASMRWSSYLEWRRPNALAEYDLPQILDGRVLALRRLTEVEAAHSECEIVRVQRVLCLWVIHKEQQLIRVSGTASGQGNQWGSTSCTRTESLTASSSVDSQTLGFRTTFKHIKRIFRQFFLTKKILLIAATWNMFSTVFKYYTRKSKMQPFLLMRMGFEN